ncbi:MAG: amidohydrolase family protein [Acidobacteriota bacterium]
MRIIDVHHHWVNEPDYLDSLLAEMDRLQIESVGLMAMGPAFQRLFLTRPQPAGCCDNEDLAKVLVQRGDRFFGYGFYRLGQDNPDRVDWFADQGFSGVKFHIPAWDYDDERCFPAYERAALNRLPCLFHTGIFFLPEPLPGRRLSSARCRPVMLDPIANEFPSLKMIIAHLGVCWGEEAAALCRIYPNIYADLSGRVDGWISSKSIDWFREMLYWPEAHRKIVFGSDVHYSQIEITLQKQTGILQQLGWPPDQIENVFYHNAREVFGF